jgi:hypothetical protein
MAILSLSKDDPAIQCARVCGAGEPFGSRTLACWVARSEAGHGEVGVGDFEDCAGFRVCALLPPNIK